MANSRVNIKSRMGENKQIQRGSSLLKTSAITTDDLINNLLEENNTKKEDDIINDDVSDISETTTISSSVLDNFDNNNTERSNLSFNSGIRRLKYLFENEEDMQKLSYDIDVTIYKSIHDIQVKYVKDENGMSEVKYIDKYKNTELLKEVFKEVKELILKTNMNEYEMNDYFTKVIDKCIHQRFEFIISFGLENLLSPYDIKSLLEGFVNIDELDQDIVKDYISEYMTRVYDVIYNRVDRSTFFINELVSESIKVMNEETKKGISLIVNDLLLRSIDEKYVKLAKINIDNRPPRRAQMMKELKKKVKKNN